MDILLTARRSKLGKSPMQVGTNSQLTSDVAMLASVDELARHKRARGGRA